MEAAGRAGQAVGQCHARNWTHHRQRAAVIVLPQCFPRAAPAIHRARSRAGRPGRAGPTPRGN